LRERIFVGLEPAALAPVVAFAARPVLDRLDREHHAGLAHFGDMRMIRKLRGRLRHAARERLVAFDHLVLGEDR